MAASLVEVEIINLVEMKNKNNNVVSICGQEKEGGVKLTWENLWVNVSDGKSGSKSILQGLTGYARPGEVLAVMGPSGCGKSTLLDALAGRLDSNTRQSGEVLINGHRQSLAYGTSFVQSNKLKEFLAYVTQDDTLITTLTVREAVYYSAQLQLPNSMSKSEKKERADTTIREMGLQDCTNTRIGGGWGAKGLSGGQKRRVSICIEILTHPKLLFLDEPTSGLDSAASYYVMSRITHLDNREGRTIITSIHQPSSEVFALFHNLYLLSSGRTVYFGPAKSTNAFFSANGFPCPTLQNPSDHFLRTINKDFDEVCCNFCSNLANIHRTRMMVSICEQDIEQGKGSNGRKPTEEVIDMLINSYKSSNYSQQVLIQVAQICKQPKCSMLMFVTSFLTFMCIGGFPSFVEEMKVFERERLNGNYGTGAFVLGNTFSAIPYLLLVSLIPGAISYHLTGLQNDVKHFAYYALVVFTCMMLVESLMMMVASVVPNFLMGIILGSGIQGLMILGAGFFVKPNNMPKSFWKYVVYNIAFHKYALQGLYKNEFLGTSYYVSEGGGRHEITGEYILRNNWQIEMDYSKWVNLAILLGMVVLYRVMFFVIIKSNEKFRPAITGKS
ncbi:hypothetical protein LguiA_008807 [Lonicera macranthoides]